MGVRMRSSSRSGWAQRVGGGGGCDGGRRGGFVISAIWAVRGRAGGRWSSRCGLPVKCHWDFLSPLSERFSPCLCGKPWGQQVTLRPRPSRRISGRSFGFPGARYPPRPQPWSVLPRQRPGSRRARPLARQWLCPCFRALWGRAELTCSGGGGFPPQVRLRCGPRGWDPTLCSRTPRSSAKQCRGAVCQVEVGPASSWRGRNHLDLKCCERGSCRTPWSLTACVESWKLWSWFGLGQW